ncbi:unnamed protein product [Parnassius mnemosyne]|uniref:Uncharacterized protein n=1 Tax=Parnassius mnemosyne TaxID=213953 RepID=A0AAV1LR94_9NEOP
MASNRSKKMIELVQLRKPAPQRATQVREHESVPSTEVKMLADITNKPENQRYSTYSNILKFWNRLQSVMKIIFITSQLFRIALMGDIQNLKIAMSI